MGHKVNPTGFRIGVIKDWEARWYADKHYADFLQEDIKLRNAIQERYREAAVSEVAIERQANQVNITIFTARPGIVIGRGGQRVDETRNLLSKLISKKVQLNIKEVQQPELDAYLVARNIAEQLERRVAFRRAMKQAMLRTMQAGAKGMKVMAGGRLGGAEIARRLSMHEGRVPLHTLRADIDYGFTEARTVMGRIGVKVWIYKGDILPEAKEPEEAKPAAQAAPVAAPAEAAPAAVAQAAPAEAAPAAVAQAAPPAEAAVVPPPVVEEKPKVARRPRPTAEAAPAAVPEPAPAAEVKPAEAEARPVRRTVRKARTETAAEPEAPAAETSAEAIAEGGEKSLKRTARKSPKTTGPEEAEKAAGA